MCLPLHSVTAPSPPRQRADTVRTAEPPEPDRQAAKAGPVAVRGNAAAWAPRAQPTHQCKMTQVTYIRSPPPSRFPNILVHQGKQMQEKNVKLKSATFFLMLTENKAFNILQGKYPSSVPDTQQAFGREELLFRFYTQPTATQSTATQSTATQPTATQSTATQSCKKQQ